MVQDGRINPANHDFSDPSQIEEYAVNLEGMTFQEVLDLDIHPEGGSDSHDYSNPSFKGGLGVLIEERFFGYKENSDERPDFPEAGVELKTTPIDLKKDQTPTAGERLVLTMIPFNESIEHGFFESHCWDKLRSILLVHYYRDKTLPSKYDQKIASAIMFTPPEEDLKIIEEDYNKIASYIKEGRAHELSEGMTLYLGACTKGATAKKSLVPQYRNDEERAKTRAFCLKRSYMDYILNQYVLTKDAKAKNSTDEAILKGEHSQDISFEDSVMQAIKAHVGKTDHELCEEFGVKYTKSKAQWTTLVYRMLGVKSGSAEEFKKSGISPRVVRKLPGKARLKENLSLNTFEFTDLVNEEWEDAWLNHYFEETRFFFVIFEEKGDEYVLKGCKFWNMPQQDVDTELYRCWNETKQCLLDGVQFEIAGNRVKNNLPKSSDNRVAHVRSHSNKAAYKLNNGFEMGDVDKDAKQLPDGQYMTTQSFWLNSDYLGEQLDLESM